MRHVAVAVLFLAIAGAGADAARAAEIRALGGTYDEPVTAIREESGRLVVRTPARAIPLDGIKSIRFQDGAAGGARRGAKLVLATKDVVRGAIQGGNDVALSISSPGLGELRVKLELIRALIFDASPERERELEKELDQGLEVDLIRLKDGGSARGTIEAIDGSKVVLNTDVEGGSRIGKLQFDVAKIELVAIAALDETPPKLPDGLRVVARLVDGSSVTGRLKGLQNDQLELEHPLGGDAGLSLPTSRLEEVVVQNGAFVYLSDLAPQAVQQRFPPDFVYEAEVWGWKRDRSVTGGPLRLGGRTFDKGLGVHSFCELTFALPGRAYREFRATIGLDDATRYLGEPGFGAVLFKVLVDGKPCKEHPNGIVQKKGQAPTELAIDVTGAASITLVADFDATSLHILGRADWADAHVVKKQ